SGRRLLSIAAREADIVALGVPQTESEPALAEKIDLLESAAGPRFEQIELNLNLMAVGDRVPRQVAARLGLTAADLVKAGAATAVTGSIDQMCETLLRRRERLGLSYLLV